MQEPELLTWSEGRGLISHIPEGQVNNMLICNLVRFSATAKKCKLTRASSVSEYELIFLGRQEWLRTRIVFNQGSFAATWNVLLGSWISSELVRPAARPRMFILKR